MIRLFSVLIIFLASLQFCNGQQANISIHKPNYIDSIQNAEQISNLLVKIDSGYVTFEVNKNLEFNEKRQKKICDSLHIEPWVKADFDNNGLTDILIIGNWYRYSILCVLDKGSKYEIIPITQGTLKEYIFPVVTENKIKCYFEIYPKNKAFILENITLGYMFGGFVEENLKPASHKIEKIEYSASGCGGYGRCSVFSLTINSDGKADLFAKQFNYINDKEVEGDYKAIISRDKFEELVNLLNYIDFDALKDSYDANWYHSAQSVLSITYDNGKIKSIIDNGLVGTFGLAEVHRIMFELRGNQLWKQ